MVRMRGLPSRFRCRWVLALLLLAMPLAGQERRAEFLLFKPGDPAATAERAEEFLDDLAAWLAEHVDRFEGAVVTGHITNQEARASELVKAPAPEMAVVPPAFYLRHLRDPALATRVVAQVPRFGNDVDRYYLVARKEDGPKSLAELRGKRVHARPGIDRTWLERVVFPDEVDPDTFFELRSAENLADDVFLMVEGEEVGDAAEQAPDALLLDEELLQFFAEDDLVWPHLEVVWRSEPLPRDLVVTLGSGWTEAQRAQLREALLAMPEHESGKELLRLMRSDGFAAPDRDLLARTAEAFDRTAGKGQRKQGKGKRQRENGKDAGEGG